MNLVSSNVIQIETLTGRTKPIEIKRDVAQGSPLSPLLFNLSINFIINDLTEKYVSDKYGYQIDPQLDNLSAMAFADDLVVIGKNIEYTTSLNRWIGTSFNWSSS